MLLIALCLCRHVLVKSWDPVSRKFGIRSTKLRCALSSTASSGVNLPKSLKEKTSPIALFPTLSNINRYHFSIEGYLKNRDSNELLDQSMDWSSHKRTIFYKIDGELLSCVLDRRWMIVPPSTMSNVVSCHIGHTLHMKNFACEGLGVTSVACIFYSSTKFKEWIWRAEHSTSWTFALNNPWDASRRDERGPSSKPRTMQMQPNALSIPVWWFRDVVSFLRDVTHLLMRSSPGRFWKGRRRLAPFAAGSWRICTVDKGPSTSTFFCQASRIDGLLEVVCQQMFLRFHFYAFSLHRKRLMLQ